MTKNYLRYTAIGILSLGLLAGCGGTSTPTNGTGAELPGQAATTLPAPDGMATSYPAPETTGADTTAYPAPGDAGAEETSYPAP